METYERLAPETRERLQWTTDLLGVLIRIEVEGYRTHQHKSDVAIRQYDFLRQCFDAMKGQPEWVATRKELREWWCHRWGRCSRQCKATASSPCATWAI